MVGGIWLKFVPTKFQQLREQKKPPVFVVAFKTSDERSPFIDTHSITWPELYHWHSEYPLIENIDFKY